MGGRPWRPVRSGGGPALCRSGPGPDYSAPVDPNHYRFRGVWRLAAPPAAVYAALADVPGYPRWWPEIRAVRETGPDSGEVLVRALLPYRLVIGLTAVRRDRAAGVLEVAMHGDLTGWSRWTVAADGTGGAASTGGTGGTGGAEGTLVLFEEDTRPAKPLLRRLALPARPLFRANHAVMMRRGRNGLAAHLAAARPATHPAVPSHEHPSHDRPAVPDPPRTGGRPAARAAVRPAPGSGLPED